MATDVLGDIENFARGIHKGGGVETTGNPPSCGRRRNGCDWTPALDVMPVPRGLVDKTYAKELAGRIRMDRHSPPRAMPFRLIPKPFKACPPHVKFVFATTEAHKVLPTIVSRCQRFEFRSIPVAAADMAGQVNLWRLA